MALEGSIKEFGLADIFQLISLQKKSGILTIHQKETSATITFYKGQIVYAVSSNGDGTDKVGRLLTSAGKLTEEKIDEALNIQGKTGAKIGHILVTSGVISKEDLKEVLQIQIKDVIFQILRWKDGGYRFDIQDTEHDKEYQIPVSTDFVLMEGVRMLDEWPYIEGIIPTDSIVFSQCYKSDEAETLFSSLSTDELEIFNLVNGQRDIKEIVNLTQLSEFEVYKILATLQVSGLIHSQTSSSDRPEKTITNDRTQKRRLWIAVQIALLSFMVSFILILIPVKEMLGINEIFSASILAKKTIAKKELYHLHRAVRYYFLINGVLPDSLESLDTENYIKKDVTKDPWGSPFVYEKGDLSKSDYRLYSSGADKVIGTPDDIF